MASVYNRLEGKGPLDGRGTSLRQDSVSLQSRNLPKDLREWLNETELAQFVDDAVQQVSRAETIPGRTPVWDILLGIISYSYAIGLYCSDEIEDSLNRNPRMSQVHTMAFGHAQPAAVLRGFRRANRNAIELCLAELFRSALVCIQERSRGYIVDLVETGVDAVAGPPRDEASARVRHAIESDCWALEV
jgi:hypothetical protein